MKNPQLILASSIILAAGFVSAALAFEGHKAYAPQDIKWGDSPASLPPGAQAAVLAGDPQKEGPFAMRLKLPDGYVIPAHTHPKPEIVTVISGTFRLGMGEKGDKGDKDKVQILPAGSFFAVSPGMAHYAFADGETVVQLNSIGPWAINYINPQDDPRQGRSAAEDKKD